MSYITTKDCFCDGRRIRAGGKYPEKKEMPDYVISEADYKKGVKPKKADHNVYVETKKADSIADVAIDGTGNPAPAASKAAIDLAKEYSVNLDDIDGSGVNGQITKADIKKFIDDNTAGDDI